VAVADSLVAVADSPVAAAVIRWCGPQIGKRFGGGAGRRVFWPLPETVGCHRARGDRRPRGSGRPTQV